MSFRIPPPRPYCELFWNHKNTLFSLLPYIWTLLFFALLWEGLSLALHTYLLPPPHIVLRHTWQLWQEQELLRHIQASCGRLLLGLCGALLPAIPVGLLAGQTRRGNAILSPFLYLFYSLPKIIFLPLILMAMGLGNAPKIFLISCTVFFHIAIVIRDAARAIDPMQVAILRSLGATPGQTFRHLLWPACLPAILTALRTGLGIALALLFITETFASYSGLGYFIMNAMETRNYEDMYAAIITLGLLGIGFYILLDRIERKACPWK